MTLGNRPSDEPDSGAALSRLEGIVEELEAATDKAARLTAWSQVFERSLWETIRYAGADQPIAFERLCLRVEAIKGYKGKADQLRAEGRRDQGPGPRVSVAFAVPGEALAGVPGRVPPGYAARTTGTWREDVRAPSGWVRVCRQAVVVVGASLDVDGGEYGVRIAWAADGGAWTERTVPRTTALVQREIVALGAVGLLVSSDNARELVRYIEAGIASCDDAAPVRVSRVCGWREGGFLLGSRFIGPGGEVTPAPITFDAADGAARLVAGYQAAGTWEGWRAAVAGIRAHPRVGLVLLASLAAPLLALVPEASNFVVDLNGTTSQGKTTALRVAASAWGAPHEKDGGIIATWEATRTWIERAAATASDLPLLVDDSKRAKAEDLSKIVYSVVQGRGKGRGTIGGTAATATWRTILISTGEAPLTSYARDGGAAARVLSLWGSPLGGQSEEAAGLARELRSALLTHHGHAGPRLLAYLQAPGRREEIQAGYRTHLAKLGRLSNGNAVAERASEYLALLAVAQDCAAAIGVPDLGTGPLDEAWDAAVEASEGADKAASALRDLYSWAASNQAQFYGREPERGGPRAWLGSWSGVATWDRLGVLTRTLREQLAGWGYDAEAILREWADRGWLFRGKDELTSALSVGGVKARVYAIRRSALVEIVGSEEVES